MSASKPCPMKPDHLWRPSVSGRYLCCRWCHSFKLIDGLSKEGGRG